MQVPTEFSSFDLTNKSFIEFLVGSRVTSWKTESACAAGDNMAGSVTAIKAKLATPSLPKEKKDEVHLIYKQIPANPPDWIIQGQIFRKEHAVYRTVVPAMQAFASSRNHVYKSPLPIFFKGFNDDKSDYLVLEDVRPDGFKMVDKRRSLTFPEMTIIVEELAKFHATGYAFLRHEGAQILDTNADLNLLTKGLFPPDEDGKDMYDGLIQLYFEVAADLVSSDLPELAARIGKILPEDAWKIRKNATKNPAYFETIIHSDLWTNNLLLKYESTTGIVPEAVKFIDFQLAQVGNIFSDLTYLVYTSTTPEFRRVHLHPLLGRYYDAFSTTLKSLTCPLPVDFSLGFLLDEFRACHVAALIHMTFAVPLQLGDMVGVEAEWEEENKNGNKSSEVGGEEGALGDKSSIRAMTTRSPIAHQRLKDLFQEAAALNVI
ncbi:uncharacterized protein LOC110861555 [Folsomia candida]|uniref:Putative oxidoreductase dhs-27 n=1 Tax=Folsomia candida TaxID=158441 RepID=A0A226D2E4_FOLCA|nr:uncharacterized protein LOC110861555 [Folsomia candida]XP_035700614.1 uncharacterized protein LOC110861555 [Folsomia candida]OXA38998.1 putative oxidoreductase dhs-27 [Folsomia candida]